MHRPICTHTLDPKPNPLPKDIYFEGPSRQKLPKPNLKMCNPQGHRPGYIALLAEAHERQGTPASALAAGALWQRAAQATIDDAVLDLDERITIDSAAAFTHIARSSRAFVQAGLSDLALEALESATAWTTLRNDQAYVNAERQWIMWDEGNLQTRVRFDALLTLAASDQEKAAFGLEALSEKVQSDGAHLEVQHELALLRYRIGHVEEAVKSLQSLWATVQGDASADTARHSRIREDYGIMAFNIGIARRAEGDLRAALGYLMQSEATGFSQSARAALEVSLLLSNDIAAALDAGLRAEAAMAQLRADEQKALQRHLVELFRRSGDRERAQEYVLKYQRLK